MRMIKESSNHMLATVLVENCLNTISSDLIKFNSKVELVRADFVTCCILILLDIRTDQRIHKFYKKGIAHHVVKQI